MNDWIPLLQAALGLQAQSWVSFITDAAGPMGWFMVIQLMFVFAGPQRSLLLLLVAVMTLLNNSWLKWLIAQPRPFLEDPNILAMRTTQGFGMPSGHAQGGAAIWGALAWHNRRATWLAAGFIVLVLLTGLSRVYLGVHSPIQVLVGWLLGLAILYVAVQVWPRLNRFVQQRSHAQLWLMWVALVTVSLLINESIYLYVADFTPPAAWLTNYRIAAGNADATLPDLGLTDNTTPILIMACAGYFAVALLDHQWPRAVLRSGQKWLLLLLVISMNLLFFYLLFALLRDTLAHSPWLGLLLALAQPVICVYLPRLALHAVINKTAASSQPQAPY